MKKPKKYLQAKLSISIDPLLAQELRVWAERENRTLSSLIEEILREGLKARFREKLKKAPKAKNLAKFAGVVSIGGDALKDSEDLYAS